MSAKRTHQEMAGSSSQTEHHSDPESSDALSPRKQQRYDFFADLKKRKEGGRILKIRELSPGKVFSQELHVMIVWKSRHPEKYFAFQGYDGCDYIVFKAFPPTMAKFKDIAKISQGYVIRNFNVSPVNERYRTAMDGTYEIMLTSETEMKPLELEIVIPFVPVTLDKVAEVNANEVIDVLGILVCVEEVRTTGQGKSVREGSLIDKSENTVPVYFWGQDAVQFNLPLKVPIALKNVQVKEFGNEKVLWFQRTSVAETNAVDVDGEMADWFKKITDGVF